MLGEKWSYWIKATVVMTCLYGMLGIFEIIAIVTTIGLSIWTIFIASLVGSPCFFERETPDREIVLRRDHIV